MPFVCPLSGGSGDTQVADGKLQPELLPLLYLIPPSHFVSSRNRAIFPLNLQLEPITIGDMMASTVSPDSAALAVRDASDSRPDGSSTDLDGTYSTPAAHDQSDSDSDDAYRTTKDRSNLRKVSEKKRVDAAAFQAWMDRNQREVTSKPATEAGDSRQLPTSEMFHGGAKIIESPREYQVELFERAKIKNIIVVLDTGKLATQRSSFGPAES